ncbi:MAG: prepilin peptidase [Sphingobium sp.]|nr:prepilin peptidase [Sphingobium sp.]
MIAPALGLVGLLIGSHIAVLVVRWPDCISALTGRSRCDSCQRQLASMELIPIASTVLLRGHCRTCHAPIPALHWKIELAACAIGVLAGFAPSLSLAIAGAVFGWQLLALACLDITRLLLPNALNGILAITGLMCATAGIDPPFIERVIGAAIGIASLALVRLLYRQARGREGLGGGDPKLLGAIGCWTGWQHIPLLVFAGSIIGLTFVLLQRLRGVQMSAEHRLPFGAMLATAAFLVWLVITAT